MGIAKVSDGVTEIELHGVTILDELPEDKSTGTSSGGDRKSQSSGFRYHTTCSGRVSSPEYLALMRLLTNGADFYFFIPPLDDGILPSGSLPIQAIITVKKNGGAGGGGRKHYLELDIDGSNFLL